MPITDTKLKRLISKSKYVSFDVFDTLVLRKVELPTDVFLLVQNEYERRFGELEIDFREARQQAERHGRKKVWAEQRHLEVTLEDVYASMVSDFRIDREAADRLHQIELQAEIDLATANPHMYQVYQYCLALGKRILLMSDMYLPKNVVERILLDCGYGGFKLYLSSKTGKTKASGELYRYTRDDLGCRSDEILHIGDNYDSDIKKAKKLGIRTYHYRRPYDKSAKPTLFQEVSLSERTRREFPLQTSVFRAMMINKFCVSDSRQTNGNTFWYDFGYKYAGTLLFVFVTWLYRNLKQNGIGRVYFLSRDAYIYHKLFKTLCDKIGDKTIDSRYLYASRRALNFPSITELDERTVGFLQSGTTRMPVKDFLTRIGLDHRKYVSEIEAAGFRNEMHVVDTPSEYEWLRSLFHRISEDIVRQAGREREYVFEYLEHSGFFEYTRFAVVDIGWHGTLQRSLIELSNLSGYKPTILGYYLGTFQEPTDVEMEIHTLLCKNSLPEHVHSIITKAVEVFEQLHLAPHGSLNTFRKEEGRIVPEFCPNATEEQQYLDVARLHDGAKDFLDDISTVFVKYDLSFDKAFAVEPVDRVLSHPTQEEAEKWGDFKHVEGFGSICHERYIARPSRAYKLLTNPLLLREEYRGSFWKTGFLVRLGRLSLPVVLYKRLQKVRKRIELGLNRTRTRNRSSGEVSR